MRYWLYVDIDAYYVSCELRDRPELVGQPVIVGPDPRLGPTRGVVLSASYEARAFGVRSALPVGRALALCPAAVWIPADFPKYSRIAEEVRTYLVRFGGRVVPLSIDEAAVEVDRPDPGSARAVAVELQAGLRTELRLPASIGVAPYRVVAKIASDKAKPGGVVVVSPEETAAFLAPLAVRSIPGVGPKTAERLGHAGVQTIADLLTVPVAELRRAVGSFADELRLLAQGTPREEVDRSGPRSRSSAETFVEDVGSLAPLERSLAALAHGLATAIVQERLWFQSVVVSARWSDFEQAQHSRRLPQRTQDEATLARVAERLLREIWSSESAGRGRRLRTISLAVGQLTQETARERPLEAFDEAAEDTVKTRPPPRGSES